MGCWTPVCIWVRVITGCDIYFQIQLLSGRLERLHLRVFLLHVHPWERFPFVWDITNSSLCDKQSLQSPGHFPPNFQQGISALMQRLLLKPLCYDCNDQFSLCGELVFGFVMGTKCPYRNVQELSIKTIVDVGTDWANTMWCSWRGICRFVSVLCYHLTVRHQPG